MTPQGAHSSVCPAPAWPRPPGTALPSEDHGTNFRGCGGGSCSDIAVSCQIKEASKIAALNYIPADECHANNGRWKLVLHEEPWREQSDLLCVTGSPRARAWAERVATCSAHACAPGERAEVTGGRARQGPGHRRLCRGGGAAPRCCPTATCRCSCSQGRAKHRAPRSAEMLMKPLSSSDQC